MRKLLIMNVVWATVFSFKTNGRGFKGRTRCITEELGRGFKGKE